MFDWSSSFEAALLIGIGAILGSGMRMYLSKAFSVMFDGKYWGTFFVNITAAFFLGLFLALNAPPGKLFLENSSALFDVVCVGFLGSLSTFSSFIGDLLTYCLNNDWQKFFYLTLLSVCSGLLAVGIGVFLGNV